MTGPAIALLSALALLAAAPAADATERDPHQRAEFVKKHPCPATGKKKGACPGYVVDHIKPLCAGGADHPSNMQWQTRAEAKKKDRLERKQCAAYRRRD
jgi:hypothetical protein